jgi:chromosome segregation protein
MASKGNAKSPRLKSLELQGYKTFASKNVFEFAPTITAIVGPNGSGKSNIADSIRWVLGEQSYSLLRGKKTEDMIFSGSDSRSRAGMATASIMFDNEEGWLPIDFTEVSVGRRAYRDSLNEYYLNGQKVRLRDVSELLAQCGLSQRTYTIIGQGLVDAALSLNPEERRKLFEEAAGISLYRGRKEEALRRLTSTRRNLERVQDILGELRPRVRSLERQAKRANDYAQVKDDLNLILRTWYGYHWYRLQDTVTQALENAEERKIARNNLRDQQIQSERDIVAMRRNIADLRNQLHVSNQQISEIHRDREAVSREFAVSTERIRWLDDQISLIESEIQGTKEKRAQIGQRLESEKVSTQSKKQEMTEAESSITFLKTVDDNQPEVVATKTERSGPLREKLMLVTLEEAKWVATQEQLNSRRDDVTEQIAITQDLLNSHEDTQRKALEQEGTATTSLQQTGEKSLHLSETLSQLKGQLEAVRERKSERGSSVAGLTAKMARVEARLEVVRSSMEKTNDRLDYLRLGSREGRIKSALGILAENIRVRSIYIVAIRAALGADRSGFVLKSFSEIDGILESIQDQTFLGRAALLPAQNLRIPPMLTPPEHPSVIGNAVNFVEADPQYQPVINLLLGRTLIVNTVPEARRIASKLPLDCQVVTLDGTILYPAGHIVLGEGSSDSSGQESPEDLEKALGSLELDLKKGQSEIAQLVHEEKSLEEKIVEAEIDITQSRQLEHDSQLELGRIRLKSEEALRRIEETKSKVQNLNQELDDVLKSIEEHGDREKNYTSIKEALERDLEKSMILEGGDPSGVALAQAHASLEVSQRVLEGAENRVRDLSEQVQDLDLEIEIRNKRIRSIQKERETTKADSGKAKERLTELDALLGGLNEKVAPNEAAQESEENLLAQLEEGEILNREGLRAVERDHSNAQITLARRQEEIVSLQHRIEDDFGLVAFDFEEGVMGQDPLPFEGLVEHLPRIDDLPDGTEAQVNRLRNQLRRMGAVNPGAKNEYEEVRDRVEFLTTQLEDSKRAEEQIQDVIAELDLLMEREFRKTFDAVAIEFQSVFTHLFAGGSARLALTNPNDLNQSGIDIEARLPGRREQGLAMLSGGERSLTACSLIFALMKVSPTPFCVLDEVDAMLDDVNVVRFREMLQDLSKNTQFVVITHNRETIQAAEVVYGVTMGTDSASQVIGLKLEEAEKVIAG